MSMQGLEGTRDQSNESAHVFRPLDDRIPVAAPSVYPFRTVGQIIVELTNGDVFQGSGSLVSDYTVLTAGHMVMDNKNNFYKLKSLRFIPGRNHSSEPYGRFDWTSMRAICWGARDWALIELAAPAGHSTGYLGSHARLPMKDWVGLDDLSHIGFPGDHRDEMWIDEDGKVESINDGLQLRTNMDAAAGQSGGPLTRNWFGARPQVVGSLAEGPNAIENPNDFMPGYEGSATSGWSHHLCTDFGSRNADDRFGSCSKSQGDMEEGETLGLLPLYSADSRLVNDEGPQVRRFSQTRSLRMTPKRARARRT